MQVLGHIFFVPRAHSLPEEGPKLRIIQTAPLNEIVTMQALVDLLPLLAFALAYWGWGMHTAIWVIMVAVSLQVLITWLVKRTVSRMLLGSAALVVVLGSTSLLLSNDLIFKWKPTVLNWVFAGVFFISRYVGDRPIAQRLIESMTKGEFQLERAGWQRLNLMWVAFFLVSGAANILVAYRFSEPVWVNFKIFGLTGMTLVFALIQGVWLTKHNQLES